MRFQLQPDENNFHEIHAGNESSAAFLDILAPPYNQHDEDADLSIDVRRDCDFYTEIRNASITKVSRMLHVSKPCRLAEVNFDTS